MEDVQSPLPSSTPLLLVKPPVGLATPAVFKALDLDARSTADPKQLLAGAIAFLSDLYPFSARQGNILDLLVRPNPMMSAHSSIEVLCPAIAWRAYYITMLNGRRDCKSFRKAISAVS